MLGTQFYHESIRKIIVSFGTMFNKITLESTGKVIPVIASELGDPLEHYLVPQAAQDTIDNGYLMAANVFSAYYKPQKSTDLLTYDGKLTKAGRAFLDVTKRQKTYLPGVRFDN